MNPVNTLPTLRRMISVDRSTDWKFDGENGIRKHKNKRPRIERAVCGKSDDEGEPIHLEMQMRDVLHSLEQQSSSEQDYQVDSVQVCGRTPERTESKPRGYRSPASSRASSSSSARTMIDERLEWAHQDRMRSASRGKPSQQSPFHEHSPFYAEFANGTALVSSRCNTYVCTCCPGKPQRFSTEDSLRYAQYIVPERSDCIADHQQTT